MATISKDDLVNAFSRLGELAMAEGEQIELLLIGGAAMVVAFNARPSTRDVDVLIVAPSERAKVRRLAERIAHERSWPADWLNEGAKGYVMEAVGDATILSRPGIIVRIPKLEQLLAMKLCAWRDDLDIADAARLLSELRGSRAEIWARISRYLQPRRELKAQYAFDDLWERFRDSS